MNPGWGSIPLHTLNHTKGQFIIPNAPCGIFLGGRRKPKYLQETHSDMEEEVKLQTDRQHYPLHHCAMIH